jgi:lipoate-protein ligase A
MHMQLLDQTWPEPEANLACDEALLLSAERGIAPPVLRFWESEPLFVVLGHSNKSATETDVQTCERDRIPVLRRCSGGGAVLQGAGCLNYSLVLEIESAPELTSITSTNKFIMDRHRAVIEELAGRETAVQGHTDLAIAGLKFSGNAQRRKKSFLLFHGTFLLDFDLDQIGKYLRFPSRQPEYRGSRSHLEFVTNLKLDRSDLKNALAAVWKASETADGVLKEEIQQLVMSKYSTKEWNMKF